MRIPILLTLMLLAVSLASAPAYGQHAEVPEAYTLTAPHPNPFNPQTQFTLSVPEAQHVTVEVYNLLGRRVDVLHDGRLEAEQSYTFTFEAANEPSGIYLIRIIGKAFTATRRVTLLK